MDNYWAVGMAVVDAIQRGNLEMPDYIVVADTSFGPLDVRVLADPGGVRRKSFRWQRTADGRWVMDSQGSAHRAGAGANR